MRTHSSALYVCATGVPFPTQDHPIGTDASLTASDFSAVTLFPSIAQCKWVNAKTRLSCMLTARGIKALLANVDMQFRFTLAAPNNNNGVADTLYVTPPPPPGTHPSISPPRT